MWPFKKKNNLVLTFLSRGELPVNAIKTIRGFTGWGLKDAKMLVDGAPNVCLEGLTRAKADEIKDALYARSPGCLVHIGTV